jgi:hypothetical protein
MSPSVEQEVCDIRMNALTEKIGLLLKPITDGIEGIRADMKTVEYVRRSDFDEKCKEIEEIKRFVWKVSGGLSVVTFLIGLAVKFLK